MSNVNPQLHRIFQALSDPIRIRIISLMLKAQTELCLCDFSESLNQPEYKLSRHLKVLKATGLITSVRDGKWIYHSLAGNDEFVALVFQAIKLYPAFVQGTKDFERFQGRQAPRDKGRCRQLKSTGRNKTEREIGLS